MPKNVIKHKTRSEALIDYLKRHKRITPLRAIAELSDYRLSETVRKLRNENKRLVPAGMEIITVSRRADTGVEYGEYRLVSKKEESTVAKAA